MLFNIHDLSWDDELCQYFHIPKCMLPKALPGASEFGYVAADIPGLEAIYGVGIYGILGDQPAALFGQTCFDKGDIKNTYGTGCRSYRKKVWSPRRPGLSTARRHMRWREASLTAAPRSSGSVMSCT